MVKRSNFLRAPLWPKRVALGCSTVVLLLGLVVMAGWHLKLPLLLQIRPGYAAMQYLTALYFALTGLATLFYFRRGPGALVLLGGGIPTVFAGLTLLHYAKIRPFGLEGILRYLPAVPSFTPHLPTLPTTLSFFLSGLALVVLGLAPRAAIRRPLIWTLPSIPLALSLMGVSGYITGISGTYVWGAFTGMALHTAAGLGLLTFALLLTQSRDRLPLSEDPWLPLPVAIFTLSAALVLWQALAQSQQATFQARASFFVSDLKTDFAIRMDGHLRALERLKHRWELRGGTPYSEWKSDADAYIDGEGIYSAIEWVDPSGHIAWIAPEEDASHLKGLDVSADTRWDAATALERARRNRETVFSPVIELKQGGRGFLAYLPIFEGDRFDGFLVGVFHVDSLLGELVDTSAVFSVEVAIYQNDHLVFGKPLQLDQKHLTPVESKMDYEGYRWKFVAAAVPFRDPEGTYRLPQVILVLGTLLTIALCVAVRAWQQMRFQARAAARSNRVLQAEIHRRRRFEIRLRESEERLRLVLDAATGVAVIAADSAGTINYFSKGAERLLGYSSDEMVGKSTPAIFHDGEEVAARGHELTQQLGRRIEGFEVFVAVPRRESSERREWTYVCKDGSRRSVDLTVTVRRNDAGETVGFLGTAVDVTEQKAMERHLRETMRAMETARALLEAAGRIARLGHWEVVLDGSGPRWSEVTYAIHEVEPGAPLGLDEAFHFFHPEDRDAVRATVERGMIKGEIFEFEARLITAKGRTIWVHTRGEPVMDDTGKAVALRGVIQDVDVQHRSAELLEERNQQLEEATRQALAYAKAKADFLANMSHEIRTPLNAVIGMSELLLDYVKDERQRELIDTIHSSGDILLTLINDILDFSRIESGQLELEAIPVDLHECVESALNIVAPLATRKKLDLLYWIDPSVPAFVQGDLTRLRQILVNLVTNAAKFTDEGEVFVRITRAPEREGDFLRVSVRDTGIGIPVEKQHLLFNAFSQVDASTTRRFGGTGLGLAICQRLVTLMKGRIWVESQVGQGSEFLFEIPLVASEVTAPTIYLRGANHDLDGVRVLLVDDNPTNLWILQNQTAAWGMQSRQTLRPEEALEWVTRGDPFDVAILDGHMAGLDGYELAGELRKVAAARTLPIVILTSMAEEREELSTLGLAARLTKPVKTAALFELISRLVVGRISTRQVSLPPSQKFHAEECPLDILVAEDNPVNQRVVALQLERLGYHPRIVSNGLEVLAALHEAKYDVVLLDIQMPEMDGYATASEICHLYPRSERPRVIALTAGASQEDQERCMVAGMDDFLSKPIRSLELINALRRAHAARHP